MDVENWILQLLTEIEIAASKGEKYDLHLEKEMVQELANESRRLTWIEMY